MLMEFLPVLKQQKKHKRENHKRIELQLPIHVSNVMLWDKESNTASRIGYKR
jgi:ribosomal protein L24